MPRQTDLAPALRDWGLPVIEVNGWQWRGSSTFNPRGAVNHHTAGARRGSIPSLRILIEGRAGLPGPLCNVGQSRSSEYNPKAKYDDVYLIAAGRANHAGRGGFRGLSGNSSVFGLEIEHVGIMAHEHWPERRQETAFRIHGAMHDVAGYGPEKVCQHEEWAPTRKIDFVDANFDGFRYAVALYILAHHQPTPALAGGDDDVIAEAIRTLYLLTRRTKDNPDYDVRVNDPKGYLSWLGAAAKSSNPVAVINNHLIPGLERELRVSGKADRLPLPRL